MVTEMTHAARQWSVRDAYSDFGFRADPDPEEN